jgi:hypothetical protein
MMRMVRGGLNGGDQEVAAGGVGELREKNLICSTARTRSPFTLGRRGLGEEPTGHAYRGRKMFQTESDQGSGILRFYCKKLKIKRNNSTDTTAKEREKRYKLKKKKEESGQPQQQKIFK